MVKVSAHLMLPIRIKRLDGELAGVCEWHLPDQRAETRGITVAPQLPIPHHLGDDRACCCSILWVALHLHRLCRCRSSNEHIAGREPLRDNGLLHRSIWKLKHDGLTRNHTGWHLDLHLDGRFLLRGAALRLEAKPERIRISCCTFVQFCS